MDNNLLAILQKITLTHGDAVFDNVQHTHAFLLDLAKDMVKERLLARHFVEAGAYRQLKGAGDQYPLVRGRIINDLITQFSLEQNAAVWITIIFSIMLGYEKEGILTGASLSSSSFLLTDYKPYNLLGNPVAIGMSHTVAVLQDGTAVAHGRNEFLQCDVGGWRHVKAVTAGDAHTIGLLANGNVLAVGRNNYDQCDVGDFKEIVSVHAFGDDTICIRQDGTAVATGRSRLNLSHFEQIRTAAWHPEGVYGIRHDGTVMLGGHSIDQPQDWEEREWAMSLNGVKQIISTYVMGSFVLTEDGRVYKMGEPDSYYAHLRDIVSIIDLTDGFAVLRADGTVRILPYDRTTPRKAAASDDWQDIVAIFGKYKRLIGLTNTGDLLAVCTDPDWLKRNGSLDFLAGWHGIARDKWTHELSIF